MGGTSKLALVLVLAALALGLCACGGGDDSTASTTQTTTEAGGSNEGEQEGSAAFRTPGGDNSIQNFGGEADAAEVSAVTAVLADYLQARAKDDWTKECAFLAKTTVAPLEQLASSSPELKGKDCATILAALSASTPTSARANTLTGPVASLRVEGNRGFALYHGAKGVDYFVPMVKEGGEWKLGGLAPNEFP